MATIIKNPFRSANSRKVFDECVRSYNADRGGIRRNGLKCGNSAATEFYRGYNNVIAPSRVLTFKYSDAESRKNMGYVYFKAGEAVALFEQANQKTNLIDDAREQFFKEQNNG